MTRKYRKRKKTPSYKIIERIFDDSTKDLSYITCNKSLLLIHARFINRCKYLSRCKDFVAPIVVSSGKARDFNVLPFNKFSTKYEYIYNRWVHLVRSCYDETYPCYKFFGAKGVGLRLDFLDSKKFCIWCLKNGLTRQPFMYDQYLLRKDKSAFYSIDNCYVTTEKKIRECKSALLAIERIRLIKLYEESHDKSVSYMTFYTRYFVYDFDEDSARVLEYDYRRPLETYGFSPSKFYKSVADSTSCSYSTFLSRMHYSYLNGGFVAKPYEMLKPEFSVREEANSQGKLSYKEQWARDRKDKENSQYTTNISSDEVYNSINDDIDVYKQYSEENPYS